MVLPSPRPAGPQPRCSDSTSFATRPGWDHRPGWKGTDLVVRVCLYFYFLSFYMLVVLTCFVASSWLRGVAQGHWSTGSESYSRRLDSLPGRGNRSRNNKTKHELACLLAYLQSHVEDSAVPSLACMVNLRSLLQCFLALLSSWILATLITPLVILYYHKKGWLDDPKKSSEKKVIHKKVVPRGGGIPIYLGIAITCLIFLPIDKHLIGILLGGLLLMIIGV